MEPPKVTTPDQRLEAARVALRDRAGKIRDTALGVQSRATRIIANCDAALMAAADFDNPETGGPYLDQAEKSLRESYSWLGGRIGGSQ